MYMWFISSLSNQISSCVWKMKSFVNSKITWECQRVKSKIHYLIDSLNEKPIADPYTPKYEPLFTPQELEEVYKVPERPERKYIKIEPPKESIDQLRLLMEENRSFGYKDTHLTATAYKVNDILYSALDDNPKISVNKEVVVTKLGNNSMVGLIYNLTTYKKQLNSLLSHPSPNLVKIKETQQIIDSLTQLIQKIDKKVWGVWVEDFSEAA